MMLHTIERALNPGPSTSRLIDPVFRVLTSLIFVVGGMGHFFQDRMMLDRMAESPWQPLVSKLGDPLVLLWLSGAVFVIFGAALALGWMTRLSALLILITLLPVTITTHVVPDNSHVGPLFKNIAIIGALLLLLARGPGSYAIDNLSRPRHHV